LNFLQSLQQAKARPVIPIGSTGGFDGILFTIIGFLRRRIEVEGSEYHWFEYLLYNPQAGFRWLVHSDNHWTLVRSVSPGEVRESLGKVVFAGKRFKRFQAAEARVDHVAGEFYWRVTVGETVAVTDYVCPPEILSREISACEVEEDPGDESTAPQGGGSGRRSKSLDEVKRSKELQWSHGTYLFAGVVEKAFGVSGLPRPSGIAPNQPFLHAGVYKYWAVFAAAVALLGLFFFSSAPMRRVFEAQYDLNSMNTPDSRIVFSEPFEILGGLNIRIAVRTDASNSWFSLEGDFINEETDIVHSFAILVQYYSGIEDGESWSEGSPSESAFLSAVDPGRYSLRLEFERANAINPSRAVVVVEQGVPRLLNFVLALGAVSFLPLLVFCYHIYFERRRWQESG
jgi:hypothetical protein